MKKSNLITYGLTLLIVGCAAINLQPNADKVIVSAAHKVPSNCQYLGQVAGNQGNSFTGGWTSNKNMAIGAMNDLRNKAAALGGNYVALLTNQASNTGSSGGGFGGSFGGNSGIGFDGFDEGFDGGSFEQTNVTNIGNVYKCSESSINLQ